MEQSFFYLCARHCVAVFNEAALVHLMCVVIDAEATHCKI